MHLSLVYVPRIHIITENTAAFIDIVIFFCTGSAILQDHFFAFFFFRGWLVISPTHDAPHTFLSTKIH